MSQQPERKVHRFEDKALEALGLLAKAWTIEIKEWLTCTPSEARSLGEESGASALARVALMDDAAAIYDTL
ncbi:MAG: hypothetical protein K2X81_14355 [Candidatus Obscuribacterales bacterium]|nr:hypothetical protein [Candidatus Obscuribacterales bacterium]